MKRLRESIELLKRNGYKILKEAFDDVSDEILDKVTQRTKDHIKRVKYFYNLMLRQGMIPEEYENSSEVSKHDNDKMIPENLRRQALRYAYTPDELTPEIEQEIQDVVHEHVKANKHHCEYWGNGDHRTVGMDCTAMPLEYVYEMLADWASTAEERGGTVDSWYRASVINVGGKRWKFSDEAVDIMEEIIPWLDGKLDKSLKRDYGLTFIDPAFLKKR